MAFKAKPWLAASSPERRGQFYWRRDEPLIPLSTGPFWGRWRALLDSGPVKVHEDYWAAHIKTGRTNGITHHPGSKRERRRQAAQTGFLCSCCLHLNCSKWLSASYRGLPNAHVFAFSDSPGDGAKTHLQEKTTSSKRYFFEARDEAAWSSWAATQRSEGKLDLGFTEWN